MAKSTELGPQYERPSPGAVAHSRLVACFLGVVLAGWGCSTASSPPDRFYDLTIASRKGGAGACRLPGVLLVNRPVADALTDERGMVFRPEGGSVELRRSAYHLWVDPPTILIQNQLAAYLKNRGVADTVVTPDLRSRADYALNGRIVEMFRSLGSPPTITLALDLSLVRLHDRRVLVQSSGVETQPAADFDQAVRAYEAAASSLFDAFLVECQNKLAASE